MRLESSIKELHDMFMDIAMLVENQVTGCASRTAGGEGAQVPLRAVRKGMLEARGGGTVIGNVHNGETESQPPREGCTLNADAWGSLSRVIPAWYSGCSHFSLI